MFSVSRDVSLGVSWTLEITTCVVISSSVTCDSTLLRLMSGCEATDKSRSTNNRMFSVLTNTVSLRLRRLSPNNLTEGCTSRQQIPGGKCTSRQQISEYSRCRQTPMRLGWGAAVPFYKSPDGFWLRRIEFWRVMHIRNNNLCSCRFVCFMSNGHFLFLWILRQGSCQSE